MNTYWLLTERLISISIQGQVTSLVWTSTLVGWFRLKPSLSSLLVMLQIKMYEKRGMTVGLGMWRSVISWYISLDHFDQTLLVIYIYYDAHIYCRSGSSWLKVTPWFLRSILVWIKKEYNNVPVLITENGISDRNGSLSDEHRIHYFRTYINYMLQGNWMIPTKRRKIKMATVYFFYF